MYKLVNNGKQYEIICKASYNYQNSLTKGKEYKTLNGVQSGIFDNSPYISFIGDDNKEHTAHASRFEIIKEII